MKKKNQQEMNCYFDDLLLENKGSAGGANQESMGWNQKDRAKSNKDVYENSDPADFKVRQESNTESLNTANGLNGFKLIMSKSDLE